MPTINLTIAGSERPAAGKKRGRIKTPEGQLFQVEPADLDHTLLPKLLIGKTYEVTYRDDSYNNNAFRVVESYKETNSQPMPTYSGGPPILTEVERQEDIAVEAIFRDVAPFWMSKVQPGDRAGLAHILRSIRGAWRDSKGPSQNIETGRRPLREEMGDELPPGWEKKEF